MESNGVWCICTLHLWQYIILNQALQNFTIYICLSFHLDKQTNNSSKTQEMNGSVNLAVLWLFLQPKILQVPPQIHWELDMSVHDHDHDHIISLITIFSIRFLLNQI